MAVSAKTFTFTGFTGALLDSRFLSGSVVVVPGGPLWSNPVEEVDYYVSTTGSDTNDGTTPSTAFLTIKKAMQTLVGKTGKVVQVQNGTYQTTNNLINDSFHSLNISGTVGARNRIQAETVGGAVITDLGIASMLYTHQAIGITNSSYVDVTGFLVDFTGTGGNGHLPATICHMGGTNGYNRIARCLVRKTGNLEPFASWFRLSGSYNLAEDCYGVGGTRYGFSSGGTESTDNHLVFRRCVGRYDYTQTNQPKSTFNHYGANGGGTTHHVAFLNCLSIDQKAGDYGGGSSGYTYGGISIIKTAANDYAAGNIVLNNECEYGGIWLDGSAHLMYDNIMWRLITNPLGHNVSPAGLFVRSSLVSVSDVQRFTIGSVAGQPIQNNASTRFSSTNNLFNPTQTYLLYPNAGPYTTTGATVINRIGTSGTFFDDSGWNTVTDEPLWPWTDEALIKTQFSRAIAIPSNGANGQTSIDTTRGFCTTGVQLDGATPVTLTSYVWEFLGTQMPLSIYAG